MGSILPFCFPFGLRSSSLGLRPNKTTGQDAGQAWGSRFWIDSIADLTKATDGSKDIIS